MEFVVYVSVSRYAHTFAGICSCRKNADEGGRGFEDDTRVLILVKNDEQ